MTEKDHYVDVKYQVNHNDLFSHTISVQDDMVHLTYQDGGEKTSREITILPSMVEDVCFCMMDIAQKLMKD
jgi:hypothetical protein